MSPGRTVALMCLAEVVGMLGFATFPALLPTFVRQWQLSGTEAGWLSGLILIGYMAAVPLLAGLTDRLDARKVYIGSALLTAATTGAFALAEGYWSAMPLRLAAGIGLAGTYMPGLRALTDRLPEAWGPRAVSFYTASFGIGISLSVLFAGEVERLLDWRWAFALSAAGALLSLAVAVPLLAPRPDPPAPGGGWLPDFRPVLRNREAMGYVAAYAAHSFELFGLRTWFVAFLGFALALQADGGPSWLNVTVVAAACNLFGMPASVLGNEAATRFGRRRTVIGFMLASAAVAACVGFAAPLWWPLVVALLALHSTLVAIESAAVTTGTVQTAEPARKGATMAVHSFMGFGFAFLGSLVPGMVLDLAGGLESRLAWGLCFLTMAAGALLGPLALLRLGRPAARSSGHAVECRRR